ncbi:MAG: ankyrin repeat domain-containing protein [Mycobacterium sp.]|nr:ankyrin repeat domain-containing protein [Mycobacterium sp.]
MLDDPKTPVDINWWRPGGTAWFTVLHQAAWHDAPAEVAEELVRRGALRSLTDAKGRTPHDVLVQRHGWRADGERQIKPPPSPWPRSVVRATDTHLGEVIDSRLRALLDDPRAVLRYPSVEVLHELPGHNLWFPVPGMRGGFRITLQGNGVAVRSSSEVSGRSGQTHKITAAGAVLLDKGLQARAR